jgi:amino acid adenylation domain-containing protein
MTDTSVAERLASLTPQQRARLAQLLREKAAAWTDGAGAIPRIDRSSGRLPMSHAQRRLYFLQRLRPDSPAYNVVEAVRVRGRLDLAALRAALAAVVARHEVLRTTCAHDDGEPMLVLHDPEAVQARLTIELVDPSQDGAPASLARVRALFARLAERPFELEREFPLRVTLARLADDDHALLFVGHHVASDAWSCRLLVEEFFRAYAAAAGGAAGDPDPPAIQYADFAAWQQAQLNGGEMRAHLAYWRQRLAGMPPVLELPLERPRPSPRSDHGAELHLDLDGELRRRLHAAARDAAVTPFALLLTAFGYVLHRHCDTEDVVVGTPVSGRDRVEVERLLGCFINTVVLRLDLGPAPRRRDLVRRVWERTLEDLEHQRLPFEHLVAELNPERDLSVGQLVQVLVNYYPATEPGAPVPGLDLQPIEVDRARAKFDLTCTVVDAADGLRVTLNYATDLLDRAQAARLGQHFLAVLEALVDDLDAPAATLPPVPPGEQAPGPPAEPAPRPAARDPLPVLDRFERHAQARPHQTATRTPTGAIAYRDLNARANRLAGWLRDRQPTPGPVALLFERSIDYMVAMLAALKAGLTYVPLDPLMPPEHVAAVLRAAGAQLLLTHGQVDRAPLAAAAPAATTIVALEELDAALARYGEANPPRQVAADQAMYVLFTSGSTGRPKGVVVEHRHFSSYLTAVLARMALPEGLSFGMVSTLAADLGLTNLYGALGTGGTLHLLPYDWATDPERLAGYFRRHRIDFMKLVPSHLQAIADAGLLEAVVPHRYLVLAGEACPWELVDAARSARPDCSVWNHYGPTETVVSVLAYQVPDRPPSPRGPTVPLGFPLDHVRVQVVDRHLRPVPRGAAGELLIAGTSVARGYL